MKNEYENHSISKKAVSPLALWRSIPANVLAAEDLGKLRAQMQRIDLVGESAWRLAKMGDAGAALGVAIRTAIKKRSSPQVVDLAMSAVLVTAIEGSYAARDFLAHMLKMRGAFSLAASWTQANRIAALNTPSASVHSIPSQSPSPSSALALG